MAAPTGDDLRVLQIHPSLRCNLSCLHCYSSSSPQEDGGLPLALLQRALEDARDEGFNVVGLSGGEPLLYSPLPDLLRAARELGLLTTVTTNGMLLTEKRLEMLREHVNLIAISLDGAPPSHNRVRGRADAFERMTRSLDALRESGIPFGFIFTLTMYNLPEVEWVAAFAAEQGASLLQVHPLEEVGRARVELRRAAPDDIELSYAYLALARLQRRYAGKMRIQYDAVDRDIARARPEQLFAAVDEAERVAEATPLAHLVSPFIIEASGVVVPVQYGFSHQYALGSLHDQRLSDLASRWKRELYPSFRRLTTTLFRRLLDEGTPTAPFTNWYGAITSASHFDPIPLS